MGAGQSSIEYLIMFGFVLVVLIPVWFYANSNINSTNERLQKAYAQNAIERLSTAADMAYVQGSPAKITVRVRMPAGIDAITIKKHEISMRMLTPAGYTDIYGLTAAPLNGSLPEGEGFYTISLTAMAGYVNMSYYGD